MVAVVLAALGVNGLLSSLVLQRRREIGIRMALGADARAIGSLVARQAGMLIAVGLVGGVAVSMVTGRWLGSFLYQVAPNDPVTFGAVAALLALVAVVAIVVPVRRATHIDAAATLRSDG